MIVLYSIALATTIFWLSRSIVNKDKVSIVLGGFTLLTAIATLVLWIAMAVSATMLGG
jgi:hypothetical protein